MGDIDPDRLGARAVPPYLIVPDLTGDEAAASDAMLKVALWTYVIGATFLILALYLIFKLFMGENPAATRDYGASTGELN